MRLLHLTLKKKWFDMIASGEKREEYREMKPYWHKRFNRKYDAIKFRNGYSSTSPTMIVELKEMLIGLGNIDWGAPEHDTVYILKLGQILEQQNNNPKPTNRVNICTIKPKNTLTQ